MECTKLLESLDIFGHAGFCVAVERSQLLQSSLLILQQENHFEKCYYWGRIDGIRNDYHVAYGFRKQCLDGQKYFYSTDCLTWFLMPEPTKCAIMLTPLAISNFQGDPALVTNVYDANPPYPPNDPDGIQHELIVKYLKEEDRLAASVYLINYDVAVVPRGGWFKTTDGNVVLNPNFEGLTREEAGRLRSYVHARLPQNKWNANLLARQDYNLALDFLDTLEEDAPVGCWSLQSAQGGRLALLLSLYWPGMVFYHKVDTPHYGSLYFGNGRKNLDVPFML
ncbi:radial spoke head protein 9 homolog [Copidosoma floridanum]|uniref:radial spoke head protein 9 homolog n=1 Tax=Copidosoma floridanum TaxID=29053 RepID=UPI0006C9DBA8|nr:radial spoke head protein 9 homolog [Copidosoma floridanum]